MYKDVQNVVDEGPPFLSKHTKLPSHLQSNNILENLGLNYFIDWKDIIHRYIDGFLLNDAPLFIQKLRITDQ